MLGSGLTVTATSELLERSLSLAVRRSRYVPGALKAAVVDRFDVLPNTTGPGPLDRLHCVVSAAGGLGRPSSNADPLSDAVAGSVIVIGVPALTPGGSLTIDVKLPFV